MFFWKKDNKLVFVGDHTFSVLAPKYWNELSEDVRETKVMFLHEETENSLFQNSILLRESAMIVYSYTELHYIVIVKIVESWSLLPLIASFELLHLNLYIFYYTHKVTGQRYWSP